MKEAAKRTTSCFTSLAKSSSSTSPSDTHLVILSLKTTIDHHWESETSQAPNKLMPYILCQIKPHYLTLDFLFKLTLNYFCHKRPSTTIGIGIKKTCDILHDQELLLHFQTNCFKSGHSLIFSCSLLMSPIPSAARTFSSLRK